MGDAAAVRLQLAEKEQALLLAQETVQVSGTGTGPGSPCLPSLSCRGPVLPNGRLLRAGTLLGLEAAPLLPCLPRDMERPQSALPKSQHFWLENVKTS